MAFIHRFWKYIHGILTNILKIYTQASYRDFKNMQYTNTMFLKIYQQYELKNINMKTNMEQIHILTKIKLSTDHHSCDYLRAQ